MLPPAPLSARDRRTALLLAAGLLAVYLGNGSFLHGHDTVSNALGAALLVEEHTTTFDPIHTPVLFIWVIQDGPQWETVPFHAWWEPIHGAPARQWLEQGRLKVLRPLYSLTKGQQGELVNTFGLGAMLTAAPVMALLSTVEPDLLEQPGLVLQGGKLTASLCAALAVALIYLCCRRLVGVGPALITALALGLGSCVWAVCSQALWQHGPAELFLALMVYAALRLEERPLFPTLCGAAAAFATVCRPPHGVVVLAMAGFLAWRHRSSVLWFLLGAAPILLLQAAYNTEHFGLPWEFAQMVQSRTLSQALEGTDPFSQPLWKGALGLLVAPSVGIVWFSPLWVVGVVLGAREAAASTQRPLLLALSSGAALQWAVVAGWYGWHGGSFGYRMVVDSLVLLAPLFALGVPWLLENTSRRTMLGVLFVYGVGVQALGAWSFDVDGWTHHSVMMERVPALQDRLWDWEEPQLLYYVRHVQEGHQRRVAMALRMSAQPAP